MDSQMESSEMSEETSGRILNRPLEEYHQKILEGTTGEVLEKMWRNRDSGLTILKISDGDPQK